MESLPKLAPRGVQKKCSTLLFGPHGGALRNVHDYGGFYAQLPCDASASDVLAAARIYPAALQHPNGYKVYHLAFYATPPAPVALPTFCSNGYYGQTGATMAERWSRHKNSQVLGGSLVHRVWTALAARDASCRPTLSIIASYKTRFGAEAHEEQLVKTRSLYPNGLNVLPGGVAGVLLAAEIGSAGCWGLGYDAAVRALADIEAWATANPCGG